MKLIIFIFFFTSIILFSNSEKLIGQNIDIKDSLIEKNNYMFSLSIVTSPLLHTNNILNNKDIFSFQSGLNISLKFGEKSGGGLTVGALFDFKNYYFKYSISQDSNNTKTGQGNYKYIYIPILFNYYFKSTYISLGAMRRISIYSNKNNDTKNYRDNPAGGILIGFGKIFPLKNNHLSLQVEPYCIFTGKYNDYHGMMMSVSGTMSSGLLIGFNLKITYKLINFKM